MSEHRPHLALVGMMGSGKSTLGRRAASELGRTFVDLDHEVELREGTSVPDLFAVGEDAFREAETAALEGLLSSEEPLLVATGGGVVTRSENRDLLRRHAITVWLSAAPEVLAVRVGAGEGRPLIDADPLQRLTALATERAPLYRDVADLVLDVNDLSIDEALIDLCVMAGSGR